MAASLARVSEECVENDTGEAEPPTASYAEIIIVRHGETDWNAVKRYQGQTNIDLNEVGRQQAVTVAERLSMEPNITAVYSSDLKRALITAETIASRCGGLEVITDKDLRDRHLGDLQGLTYQESLQLFPRALETAKSASPDQEILGGGESRNQLYERCTSLLQRIAEKHRGGRVVVVTHGLVIEMLYKRALPGGNPEEALNTSISIIQVFEGGVWSIRSWNDISHLENTQFLESTSGGGHSRY